MRRLFSGNSGGYGGRGRADITEKGQIEYSGQRGPLNPVQKGPVITVERGPLYMVDFAC